MKSFVIFDFRHFHIESKQPVLYRQNNRKTQEFNPDSWVPKDSACPVIFILGVLFLSRISSRMYLRKRGAGYHLPFHLKVIRVQKREIFRV
eukprot:UN23934